MSVTTNTKYSSHSRTPVATGFPALEVGDELMIEISAHRRWSRDRLGVVGRVLDAEQASLIGEENRKEAIGTNGWGF